MTLNSPRLSTDLADRAVTVNLELEGNPDKRTFSTSDLIAHAKKQRLSVLADLVGMVERWREAGMPRATIEFGRFPTWAALIGGVLQVSHVSGFLSNRRLALTEQDSELQDLLELGLANLNVALSPTDWLTKARGLGVLGAIFERPTPRSQSTSMGLLLTRALGRRLRDVDSGQELVIVREYGEKNSLYRFVVQDHFEFAGPDEAVSPISSMERVRSPSTGGTGGPAAPAGLGASGPSRSSAAPSSAVRRSEPRPGGGEGSGDSAETDRPLVQGPLRGPDVEPAEVRSNGDGEQDVRCEHG
jgi:hypothetical protein